MRDTMRLIATTIIWGAFISVAGISLSAPTGPVSRMNGGEVLGLMAVLMVGAVAMTYMIWHNGIQRDQFDEYRNHAREAKLKRVPRGTGTQDRVARLIDSLDDEDIYELEALLLDREREPQRDHSAR